MDAMHPSYFRLIDSNLISGRSFWDHGHYMGPWMKLLDKARDPQS
jgi:protease I